MPLSATIRGAGLLELRAAIAVAERRSFRAAADALGMSPTALSSTVRSLEDRLGIRLFNRTTRSVAPTSAGEEFIARIIPSLADIDRAIEDAGSQSSKPGGVLRINSSVTAAHEILAPVIRTFLDRHPNVQVELATETRLVDVVLDGYDAGIRLGKSVPADMVAVPLHRHLDFCVVGAPDYLTAQQQPKIPADLMAHRCIRAKIHGGGVSPWEFETRGKTMALDVPGPLMLDEQSLMLRAAINGMGLAYVARIMASEAVAAGRLRYVLDEWMPVSAPLCLYYPRNRNTSAALRALIAVLRSSE